MSVLQKLFAFVTPRIFQKPLKKIKKCEFNNKYCKELSKKLANY